MPTIQKISGRMILDSRGEPTVEARVELSDGTVSTSAAPSGASKGSYEAAELRDQDPSRWNGKGVEKALEIINTTINQALSGIDAAAQQAVDKALMDLDGTQNKSKLGGNTTIAVSQAVVKAAARSSKTPLPLYIRSLLISEPVKKIPTPMFNILEGGQHASNGLNFQEFLIIPTASKSFDEKMNIGVTVYHTLKKIIAEKSMSTATADEGGFEPDVMNNIEALNLIRTACERSAFKFSLEVFAGIDAASNHFYHAKAYNLLDKSSPLSSKDLAQFYRTLFHDYGLLYIEDPFAEDDLDGWKEFKDMVSKTLVVGDDLTTTNPYRLQMALDNQLINSIIIKLNQIGTVTETIAVVEMARAKNIKIIVSHRSGETHDPFAADFALGVAADYVKFGAPSRERVTKYNRIWTAMKDIEELV